MTAPNMTWSVLKCTHTGRTCKHNSRQTGVLHGRVSRGGGAELAAGMAKRGWPSGDLCYNGGVPSAAT